MPERGRRIRQILLIGVLAAALAGGFLVLRETGWLARLGDKEEVRRAVEALGLFGPAAVIGLLALAIVMSPVPSAPVAMAAGAVYGPVWGTVLTIAGSVLGAFTAFAIARFVAYDAVRKWEVVRRPLQWLEKNRSQTWLMAVVFASRLVPFISFDAVSYAAGLTPLVFWRFAVATLAGVAPISFLLAYGGDALFVSGEASPVLTLLALGGITAIPIILRFLWVGLKRRRVPAAAKRQFAHRIRSKKQQ